MEPITTSIIGAALIDLVKTGALKAFDKGSEQIGENSANWLKSIFFKNDKPKVIVESMLNEPNSRELQKKIDTLVECDLEDNPLNKGYFDYLSKAYKSTTISNNTINSKNISNAPINAGGDVKIGDNL